MANSDKNILITPNSGQAANPNIVFSAANVSVGPSNITLQVYPGNQGTLSFEGSSGQLFSITNDLTGTIFSVNDISGMPSIEVLDTGLVKIAQYAGNVLIGTGVDNNTGALQVNGTIAATNINAVGNVTGNLITTNSVFWANGAAWRPSATGTTGQIQYNSAGIIAAAPNVIIDNGDLTLLVEDIPVAPPANTVKLMGRNIAGRIMPAFVGPSGLDTTIQPLLGRNKIAWFNPSIGSALLTSSVGITVVSTGTATASTWAATTLATSTIRVNARAAAATTSVAGFRGGATQFWRGNAAGLGGFTYIARWSIGSAVSVPVVTTLRAFAGLRNSIVAATDVSPTTLTNAIGMGWESASTTLQIYCAGTVLTQINTGITLNRAVESTIFEIAIFCPPFGSTINIQVTDVGTGASFATSVSAATNIPATTMALNPYMWASAGGTSTAMGFNVHSIYVETDS